MHRVLFAPRHSMDNGKGQMIEWGVHIGGEKGFLPFLERYDYKWKVE